jgi:ubiquinone/menaquinone biosynthesis C-methylase UbiE
LSGDVLKENSGELLSEHEQTRFTVYDGIPDFATQTIQSTLKEEVQEFWDNCPNESVKSAASIGTPEYYADTEEDRQDIHANFNQRFLNSAIGFDQIKNKTILEVGCGIGLDAIQFARNGNKLHLMDLSLNSIKIALGRLQNEGYKAVVCVGDANKLPFADNSFDLIYSFGVLHHSPDTESSIREIYRTLKPGGQVIVMLYSKWSANMIFRTFVHNGLIKREIFKLHSISKVLNKWTELQSKTESSTNPLTQVFSYRQIRKMFYQFDEVKLEKHFINRYQMAEARVFLRFISEKVKNNLHKYLGWNTIIKAKK